MVQAVKSCTVVLLAGNFQFTSSATFAIIMMYRPII